MTSPDREITLSPRDRFISFGLPREFVDEGIDVLTRVETVNDLELEFQRREFACDREQFLLPLFRPLYQADEGIHNQTVEKLVQTGMPLSIIDEYLNDMGDQPYVILGDKYGKTINHDMGSNFIDQTCQIMFDTLRSCLELAPKGQQ